MQSAEMTIDMGDERIWHRSSPKSNPRRAIPGFGLTLGFTITWLSLIVLIPLSTIFIRATGMGWDALVAVGLSARARQAYRLGCGASQAAGGVNPIFSTEAGRGGQEVVHWGSSWGA